MSTRPIKKAVEEIVKAALNTADNSINVMRGHSYTDLEATAKPRLLVGAKVARHSNFPDDAVYNVAIVCVYEADETQELETDADTALDVVSSVLCDVDALRAEALTLYPSTNISFSEFHFSHVMENNDDTDFNDLTALHQRTYTAIIQRLTTS